MCFQLWVYHSPWIVSTLIVVFSIFWLGSISSICHVNFGWIILKIKYLNHILVKYPLQYLSFQEFGEPNYTCQSRKACALPIYHRTGNLLSVLKQLSLYSGLIPLAVLELELASQNRHRSYPGMALSYQCSTTHGKYKWWS